MDLATLVREQAREIAALRMELAERREQFRVLIQHNPRPAWIYCFESLRFLDVNDAAVARYGWSRDEFLAMTIADIRPAEEVPALVANVAQMRAITDGSSGPWNHQRKDGTLSEVSIGFHTLPFDGRAARLIVVHDHAPPPRPVPLSRREREVLCLVARGHTTTEIASRLSLSPKSVETYRSRVREKLFLRSRADLVAYAIEHGIL